MHAGTAYARFANCQGPVPPSTLYRDGMCRSCVRNKRNAAPLPLARGRAFIRNCLPLDTFSLWEPACSLLTGTAGRPHRSTLLRTVLLLLVGLKWNAQHLIISLCTYLCRVFKTLFKADFNGKILFHSMHVVEQRK